ncbi:MAG TPA: hypothetical protein VF228_14945, partial [Iamia sp.]
MADWPTRPPEAPPTEPGLRSGGAEYPSHPPDQWPAYAPMAPTWGGPPGSSGPAPAPDDGSGRSWPVVVTAVAVVCALALL